MPTLKQFKDVHGAAIRGEVDEWRHLGPRPNWSEYSLAFPGGSWIAPFPAADHSSQRARGIRADIAICDEADDIDPGVFDSVIRPWFSEPWSLKIRLTSGTYKRGRHGLLYRRRLAGLDQAQPRYHTIHATYRDSPEIVDLEEVEDARKNTAPAVFSREWECDPDSGEGLVYPFDESFHVRKPPENLSVFREFVVGVDHGWVDPGVFLLIGIQGHGQDATAWVLQEWYESECPNSRWNERAKAWQFARAFFSDPSRPDRINELRAHCNPVAADNNILGGIARVADMMFRRPPAFEENPDWCRLYVAPICTNTIKEFNTYRRKRDPRASDQFMEDPEDKNNHAMDALRYALVGVFGRGDTGRHVVSGR